MATGSTTFMFASPRAFPTGFIEIGETELSRTSPSLPESDFSKIRPARFSPTSTNDGRQDLIVVRANGPLLFLNQGGGKFRLKPNAFQFANPPQGTFTGAAAADYDRDGWLDIYFCLYAYYQGADQYKYPAPYYAAENGPPNFMLRNNRDGTFRDVTAQSGLNQNNTRYSFCCGWGDYNRDGWPDLYVVNDFGRKNLYRNNGDGTFTDVAPQAGVEDVGAGMGVCWFDYDNDGVEDLYVADMWTAAGERISTQEIFQRDAPAARPARCIANTPWAIRYSEIAATEHFRMPPRRVAPEWADGRGRATPGISIMTAFPISISPTEWFPARFAKT